MDTILIGSNFDYRVTRLPIKRKILGALLSMVHGFLVLTLNPAMGRRARVELGLEFQPSVRLGA